MFLHRVVVLFDGIPFVNRNNDTFSSVMCNSGNLGILLGLGDMLDEVVKYFPEGSENQPEDERPKVAIIGKPNVGKSSLINKLAQEEAETGYGSPIPRL